jgi:hypothetical protein
MGVKEMAKKKKTDDIAETLVCCTRAGHKT